MVAKLAIPPSATRNTGCRRKAILQFLGEEADLGKLGSQTLTVLNSWTDHMEQRSFGPWGVLRKASNLFARGCLYNWFLRDKYVLNDGEGAFELPLDSLSMKGLKDDCVRFDVASPFDNRPALKQITREFSKECQEAAAKVARKLGTERVHLDLRYWS